MPTEFKIPELGENVTAGDVVRVLVKPGDTLAPDQPVLELETDKATIEVPSTVSGKVVDIAVKQGDKVKVGQLVLTVDTGDGSAAKGADAAPAEPKEARKEAQKEETAKPKPPPAGAAQEGGQSQSVPSSETSAEPQKKEPAPKAAQKEETAAKPKPRGEVVDINRGTRTAPPASPPEPQPEGPAAPAAPSVRRLARELGVEIGRVAGSGPGGRISVEDVQEFVKGVMSGSGAAPGGAVAAQALPDFSKWGEVERKPMSNIRRKTAEHLSHAWNTIPHVTQHDKADITDLEELRKKYGPEAEKAGGKLTMTAIALKIAAGALRKFPHFNSSIDLARNEVVYKKAVHAGVAVDTPRGLLVPVIRNVDQKGIFELSVELATASEKARAGKLSLDEMQGGGFTITNLGGIGGTSFTPIVNWPEVAILGISRGAFEPAYMDGEFRPRLTLPLSLSYDHRAIDGADAARFLRWICSAFEQPLVLSL